MCRKENYFAVYENVENREMCSVDICRWSQTIEATVFLMLVSRLTSYGEVFEMKVGFYTFFRLERGLASSKREETPFFSSNGA